MNSELLNAFLLVYAGLLPVVNPFGNAPLFLGLTDNVGDRERSQLARGVAVNSFFLLLGSLLVGSYVLEFFGISLPVVRIAGGLVITAFGWKLLNAEPRPARTHAEQASTEAHSVEAFYPLTMPLTVGPGSISVAITLGSQRPKAESFAHVAALGGMAVAALLAMALTVYLVYRYSPRVMQRLGKAGTQVVVRLSAFIMLCIGIQILWNGWLTLHG